jgi:GNAT superfamily N-acetyltransferase
MCSGRASGGSRACSTSYDSRAVELLGWITDRLAPPREVVTDVGGARLVRTPDLPDFWFGNFLELDAPPAPDELPGWLERWEQVIGEPPPHKRILAWEAEQPTLTPELADAARALGLEPEHDVVLTLRELHPRSGPEGFVARPCRSDADWAAALEIGSADARDQADFYRRLQRHHRERAEAGFGEWWIGELGGQAVATAGIYWNDEGTLARYQRVDTRTEARRKGCASALLTAMALDARKRLPDLDQIVIVAEVGEAGEQVYRRLGFAPASYAPALVGPPPERRSSV